MSNIGWRTFAFFSLAMAMNFLAATSFDVSKGETLSLWLLTVIGGVTLSILDFEVLNHE